MRYVGRGYSLAEVIVSLALVSLLMLALDRVLWAGTRYFRHSTMVTEIQKACVTGTGRLVTELLEGNPGSIRGDQVNFMWVTFGGARDPQGKMTFDPTSGDLQWHSQIGYYIDTINGEEYLCRKEEAISPPQTTAPLIALTMTDGYWKASTSQRIAIAQRVYYLDVVSTSSVSVILGVRSSDHSYQMTVRTKLKARN